MSLYNEVNLICDRDKELGCKLLFLEKEIKDKIVLAPLSRSGTPLPAVDSDEVLEFKYFPFIYGGDTIMETILEDTLDIKYTLTNNTQLKVHFPNLKDSVLTTRFTQSQKRRKSVNYHPPYSIFKYGEYFGFEGKIFDVQNNELLGWFDQNEFGVIKPCAFSWNKDNRGIEIIDKFGNVCFSIQPCRKYLLRRFPAPRMVSNIKATLKWVRTIIFSMTKPYITSNLDEALYLARKIQPLFDHFGKNSTGKRLK